MKNTPNVPGLDEKDSKKSKRKIVIAAVLSTMLIAGIAFGAAINYFGMTKMQFGTTTTDEVQEKAAGTDVGTETASFTEAGFLGGDISAQYNLKSSDNVNSTVVEVAEITSSSLLKFDDIYIDEVSIDSDYEYISYVAGTTQTNVIDLPVLIELNSSSESYYGYDTIDIDAGKSVERTLHVSKIDVEELKNLTSYTLKATVVTVASNGDNEHNEVSTNDSDSYTFTKTSAATSASDDLDTDINTDFAEETKTMGSGDFDTSLSSTQEGTVNVTTGQIEDITSSVLLSIDDIYIDEIWMNDDKDFMYATIGSTQADVYNLKTEFSFGKKGEAKSGEYDYIAIEGGTLKEISLSTYGFVGNNDLDEGTMYEYTLTIEPRENNDSTSNDSESYTFTTAPSSEAATGSLDLGTTDKNTFGDPDLDTDVDYTYANETHTLGDTDDLELEGSKVEDLQQSENMTLGENDLDTSINTDYAETDIDHEDEEETTNTVVTDNLSTEVNTDFAEEDDDLEIATMNPDVILEIVGDRFSEAEEVAEVETDSPFTDVSPSDYFAEAAQRLFEMGILNGYEDGGVHPSDEVNRATIVYIAMDAFGYPTYTNCGASFSDVSTDAWFYDAVYTAACYGVINSDTTNFRPGDTVTRDEAIKVLIEASTIEDMPDASAMIGSSSDWTNPYIDVLSSHWFYEYVMEAYYGGIISAAPDADGHARFRPGDVVVRGEMITMIDRLLTLLGTATI